MNESARKRLGKIAKELRKKAKKSQQELADALNIARTDISAFEKRGEKLGLERMETLFDFFGCEITVSEKKPSCLYDTKFVSQVQEKKCL